MKAPISFEDFFEALTGHRPYQWQRRLCREILAGRWKDQLLCPTGSGKTYMVVCWLYGVYIQSQPGATRTVPLRLHYVIDRRILVDDNYRTFRRWCARLRQFKKLKGVPNFHVDCFPLRGGLSRYERRRAADLETPCLTVSTVDQYGSRLLFRGYGCGVKVRPMLAALAYYDSLVVSDEAHLNFPLRKLLEQAKALQGDRVPLPPPVLVEMTATPKGGQSFNVGDFADLNGRVNVRKHWKFVSSGKSLAPSVASAARALVAQQIADQPAAVGVVCNTVTLARAVFKALEGHSVDVKGQRKKVPAEVFLIHGQNRPFALKERAFRDMVRKLKDRKRRTRPIICVCTQTLEVGMDFDFDHMVTQIAPLDALIQRFGRVNRFGLAKGMSEVRIVHSDEWDDPVYGERSKKTFDFIRPYEDHNSFPPPITDRAREELFAPDKNVPNLLPEDAMRFAATNPDNGVQADTYLHGLQDQNTDVYVVYRDWAVVADEGGRTLRGRELHNILEEVEAVRPQSAEAVAVPISALLRRREPDPDVAVAAFPATVEAVPEDAGGDDDEAADEGPVSKAPDSPLANERCYIVRYGRVLPRVCRVRDVRPGDTVVFHSRIARLTRWGWDPDVFTPPDGVRMDIYNLLAERNKSGWYYLRDPRFRRGPKSDEQVRLEAQRHLTREMGRKVTLRQNVVRTPAGVLVYWIDPNKESLYDRSAPTEDVIKKYRTLDAHTERVYRAAVKTARDLGLSNELQVVYGTVAKWHDLGKADPRFQRRMYGGSLANPDVLMAKPVVKSGGRIGSEQRHELLSLQVLEDSGFQVEPLVRHLIGTHHGHYRPFAPAKEDDGCVPFTFHLGGRGYRSEKPAGAFMNPDWVALNQQYGPWGLALLETVFRHADWKASDEKR